MYEVYQIETIDFTQIPEENRKNITYEELRADLNNWLEQLESDEKALNTLKKYRNNVSAFIEFCKDRELSKRTVRDFKEKLVVVDKYLSSTMNNYIISINKFLKYIGKEELVVQIIKVQKKYSLEEYMTLTDYRRLLRFIKNKDEIQSYYIFRILGETGIRISELQYFTVERLNKTMVVKNKGKEREIIVKQDLLRDLRKYIRDYKIKSGPIFLNKKTGKSLTPSCIYKRMKKFAGQARIKKDLVHPHAFRHLFARQYLEQYPNDIVGLADLLGHNSLETTRIYAKLSNKEKELKLRKIKF